MRAWLLIGLVAVVAQVEQTETTGDTPTKKVLQLLQNLQRTLEEELTEETKTYDTLAGKCKLLNNEKSADMKRLSGKIEADLATHEAKTADEASEAKLQREKHQEKINKENERAEAKQKYEEETAVHNRDYADTDRACKAIDNAISSLEGGKGGKMGLEKPTFLQVQLPSIRRWIAVAEALNFKSVSSPIAALLQGSDDEPDVRNFEYHSQDIIDLLGNLKKEFDDKRTELDTQQKLRKKTWVAVDNGLDTEITLAIAARDGAKGRKLGLQDDLGNLKTGLVNDQGDLHDSQVFLKEVTATCEEKAKLWDQRFAQRSQELAMLKKAEGIISGAEGASKFVARSMLQKPHQEVEETDIEDTDAVKKFEKADLDEEPVSTEAAESDDDVEEAAADEGDVDAFLQLATRHIRTMSGRQHVVAFLQQKATSLKSRELAEFANKVAADPLANVKKFMQELIERLLKEHNEEVGHKGMCDSRQGKAIKERDYAQQKVMSLSASIAKRSTDAQIALADATRLEGEITDLNNEKQSLQGLRDQENAENTKAIENAQAAHAATKEAHELLRDYYRDAGNEANAFIQQTPAQAGLEDGTASEKYGGNSAGSNSILGMLEVMIDDFARSEKQITEEEAEAFAAWTKLKREMDTSIAAKTTEEKNRRADRNQALADMNSAHAGLQEQSDIVDGSMKTMVALRPLCVTTGMTYEQRKAKREAEISALKTAWSQLHPDALPFPVL